MTLDSVRIRFQNRQEALFRDEAILERPSGTDSLNTSTGVVTYTAATEVYAGPCLIRGFTWEGTDLTSGGNEVRMRSYRVKFPVDTGAQIDDVVRVTASNYDPSLVDRTFRVTDVPRDGWQISRWCICEEVTGDA